MVNRTVIHILRGYFSKHPKLWDGYLPYVQHVYNRALYSSTNRLPFEICLGYLRKSPMEFMLGEEDKVDGHDDSNNVVKIIQCIQQIHEVVQDQLEKS